MKPQIFGEVSEYGEYDTLSFSSGGSFLLASRRNSLCDLFFLTREYVKKWKTLSLGDCFEMAKFANESLNFLSIHSDGWLKIWNLDDTSETMQHFKSDNKAIIFAYFSAKDNYVVFSHLNEIKIWSILSKTLVHILTVPFKTIFILFNYFILYTKIFFPLDT